jgi:hypothetical protein
MIKDKRAIVIDYKFGKQVTSTHEKQVREYAEIIRQMGYSNVEAYVWYAVLRKVVNVRI